MQSVKLESELTWEDHPFLPIKIKRFLTHKEDQAEITCLLVRIPTGQGLPVHVHETQEDILYIVSGQGKMWIEGVGDFTLERGRFVRVPKNTRHKIYDVTEEIINYDVFSPALM